MSALIIDTSSWISYFGGVDSPLIDEALAEARVHLPLVVAAELLSGSLRAKQREALEDLLEDLPPHGHEMSHWFRVGHLRSLLAAKGVSASIPDTHVAQCAIDLQAELLSEDRIFRDIAKHCRLRLAGP